MTASLPIGPYKLDTTIAGAAGLTEFSRAEYSIYGRHFDGETDYNAPDVSFMGRPWKVSLATVHGTIYKIAFFFDCDNKSTALDFSVDVIKFCRERLGKPSDQQQAMFMWKTPDGNVVLSLGHEAGSYMISLFETSNRVKTFQLKR